MPEPDYDLAGKARGPLSYKGWTPPAGTKLTSLPKNVEIAYRTAEWLRLRKILASLDPSQQVTMEWTNVSVTLSVREWRKKIRLAP
jgi:hypothetical protein